MARYGDGYKEATRQRLVAAAGRRFKRDGIVGSGVAVLVADAGLTNGAFYGHFTSKHHLVATVVADQLAAQRATIEAVPKGAAGVAAFIRQYLSAQHRDDPENGCPSAALLEEIGRCPMETRRVYTDGIELILGLISDRLPIDDRHTSADCAASLFTLLVSTLQLARAVSDSALSDRILGAGINNALTLAQITDSESVTTSTDRNNT